MQPHKALIGLLLLVVLASCTVRVETIRIAVTPSSVSLAPGETVNLTASINYPDNVIYSWTLSGGTLSDTTGTTVTYTAPETFGTYTVSAKATNVVALAGSATIEVVDQVSASADPNTPVRSSESLNSGETKRYKVNVPSGLTGDLLYFELSTDKALELVLYDADNNAIAQSSNKAFFSKPGLTTQSELDSQAITVEVVCRGPCAIIKKKTGSFFLEITAKENASYDLYTFSDVYQDTAEPDDADCSNLSSELNSSIAISAVGAIETLDDLDCINGSGDVASVEIESFATTAIVLVADIYSDTGEKLDSITAGPGAKTAKLTLATPRPVQIVIRGQDQAGPAKNSKYKLTLN